MLDAKLNGRPSGPPPSPLTIQAAERLVRKIVAESLDLTAFTQIFDPWDLLLDTGNATGPRAGVYPSWPFINYRQSQKRGEDLPYYYDENQLRFIRDRQRKLVAENPFAQCGIANFTNYCVGADGLKISAVSARKDCPPRLIERAQRVIDLFIEENEFGEYCKDRVAQGHINGDAPTRLFPDDDTGILRIRPIEAEHVRTPAIGGNPYGPEYSFGVQTLPDDVETIVGVWVVEEPLVSPLPKFVPHDQVNWLKFNSPRSAKRGLPLFARGSCEYLLRMAMRLLSAAGSTAIQRAKIGLIKYLDGVINDAAQRLAAEMTNYTVTDPASGQVKSIQEYPDGAVVYASGNQRWEMPGSNFDAQVFEVAGKMILRAVAAYLNFPEFMLTADPSSGTFANAFIAEAPSTRAFESFQHDFIRRVATNRSRSRRSIVWAQIVHAVKCGILAPETLHLVQIQAEGPTMVVRDQNQEANTNKTYHEMGVLSKKTIQLKIGVDPDQENENLEAEAARAKKMQPARPDGQAEPGKEDPDGRGPGPREPNENSGGLTESVQGKLDRIDTEDLAHFYAELWAGRHPKEIGDPELATVHDELGHGVHTLSWDEKSGWRVKAPGADPVVAEAVHRAPKGGISIRGKPFRGGMFIPAQDYAKASAAEKEAIDNPARAAAEKRKARDTTGLRQRLETHRHHELSAEEEATAKRSLASLRTHHGALTRHRLDELSEQLQAQHGKTKDSARRERLSRRLKAVQHQLDLLDQGAPPPANTLYKEIRKRGGIDPASLAENFNVSEDFIQSGLLGVLKKGGMGLDEWAATLQAEGHIDVPENVSPDQHLLELLKSKALSLHDDVEWQVRQSYERHLQEVANAQEAGLDESSREEIVRLGEEAGILEEEKGEAWEGPPELAHAQDPDEVEPWDEPAAPPRATLNQVSERRFAIESNGREIGHINFHVEGNVGEIDDAYLSPSERGKKLMPDLYPQVERHLQQQGATKIVLTTVDPGVGEKVWAPLGFRRTGRIGKTERWVKELQGPKTESVAGDRSDIEDGLTALFEAVDCRALFEAWDESKHDRADDGTFGAGGGGDASSEADAKPGAEKPPSNKELTEKAGKAAEALDKLDAEVAPAIAADPEVKAHAESVYRKIRRIVAEKVWDELPRWAVEHADVWVFEEIMNASTGTGSVLAVKAATFAAAKAYLVGRKVWKKMRGIQESVNGQPPDIEALARRMHELMQEIALHAGWKAPSMKELTERLKASAP